MSDLDLDAIRAFYTESDGYVEFHADEEAVLCVVPDLVREVERLRDDIASLGHWDCANCENCPGTDDDGMCTRCGNQAEWWEPDTITKMRELCQKFAAGKNQAYELLGMAEAEVERLKAANAEQWQNGAEMGAELDRLGAEVERLRANQLPDGAIRADERARIVRLLRLGGGYHRIADMIQSGLFGPVSDSAGLADPDPHHDRQTTI